jgi:protein phosphatase
MHDPHLGVAQCTHPGLSGKTNEDRLALAAFHNASGQPVLFIVVSDGIGGHRAGEVAAELTVQHITGEVSKTDGSDPLLIMEAAIHSASQAIAERSASHANEAGMGSTCACVWVENDRLFTSHVGDSRIYLVRDGRIHRVTIDHTWVQEAIERGILTPEQGLKHPNAHVLRRHLGATVLPEVDTRLRLEDTESDEESQMNQGLQLGRNDILLLCTDGLTDMVRDDEILRLVTKRSSLKSAAEDLVERANEQGGRDNITVALVGAPQAAHSVGRVGNLVRRVIRV